MHPSTRPFLRTALALALLTALPAAHATNDDPALALLTTSFSSPGARAAGMGGAFIGYARDSSTVFLNPAGIPLLARPELTVEWRARNAENTYLQNASDFVVGTEDSSTGDLSYATLAFPGAFGVENLGLGVFYGTLAKAEFAASSRVLPQQPANLSLASTDVRLSQRDRYYGLGAGYRIGSGPLANLSMGAAVYRSDRSVTGRSRFGTTYFSPTVDDSDIGINLGILYDVASVEGLSFGANWRKQLNFVLSDLQATDPDGEGPFQATAPNLRYNDAESVIPSSFAVGFSFSRNSWTFTGDYTRIRYSEITDARAPVFVSDATATTPRTTRIGSAFGLRDAAGLRADDGGDLRLGVEYLLATAVGPVFLRGGFSHQSDPAVYFANQTARLGSVLFSPRDDSTHLTLGLGWVAASDGFGFDLAIDRSSERSEFVLSGFISLQGLMSRGAP